LASEEWISVLNLNILNDWLKKQHHRLTEIVDNVRRVCQHFPTNNNFIFFEEIVNLGIYKNEKELINLFLLNNAIEYNKMNELIGPSYMYCELDGGKRFIIVQAKI